MVVSPAWAGRPPSSLTYSLLPTKASSRGAMPTFHVCLTAPVVGSSASTVFCPLSAAYSVDPSGEYLIWPTSAELGVGVRLLPERWVPTLWSGKRVGVPRVPSAVTGNRVRVSCCGSQRNLPSGEYVGPSCPTVPSESVWFTPD